jgi:hypothetical protein
LELAAVGDRLSAKLAAGTGPTWRIAARQEATWHAARSNVVGRGNLAGSTS